MERLCPRDLNSLAGTGKCSISLWDTAVLYCKSKKHTTCAQLQDAILDIISSRPTYGIRRMAAQASRVLGRPVNRKAVSRIFKRPGWNEPAHTKEETIHSNIKPPRPDAPNKFWKSDMSYIWCVDGWCYCFNVIDVFSRRWVL